MAESPAPLSVGGNSPQAVQTTRQTRCTTIWAIRSPRRTMKGVRPWLIKITPTSPR